MRTIFPTHFVDFPYTFRRECVVLILTSKRFMPRLEHGFGVPLRHAQPAFGSA